jgi:hypothetical protein
MNLLGCIHSHKLKLFCHYNRVSLMDIVCDHRRSGNRPSSEDRRGDDLYFYPAGSATSRGVKTWAACHKVYHSHNSSRGSDTGSFLARASFYYKLCTEPDPAGSSPHAPT